MNIDPQKTRSISALDILISDADSIKSVLKIGLTKLLEIIERNNGGIFLPKNYRKREFIWFSINPLNSWIDDSQNISAQLHFEIVNFIEGKSRENSIFHGYQSQLFPLYWKNEIQAVIVLDESKLTESDQLLLDLIGNIVSREIFFHQTKITTIGSEQYLTTLRIISATQSSELNLNDVELWILKGIKDTFKGEVAGLVLVDAENPSIAQKKMVDSGSEWIINDTIRFEKGILKNCIDKGIFYQVVDVLNDPKFDYETDSCRDITKRAMICSPIIVNSKTVGVITIYNSPHTPLDAFDQGLLVSLTTSLANSIYNNQLIQQLKIANADLEASGWELLNSRNTLRALFDSIPASFYIIDRNYALVAINRSRALRAGVAPNQLVGKRCFEALYQLNDPCAGCEVGNTLYNGILTNRSQRFWSDNDTATEWEISTYPILDNNNLVIQAILFEQDVTEKRHLETELVQSEKLAAVGQLAAGVAHEINNPLAAVIANAQLLIRDLPPKEEDWIESARIIEIAGQRAGKVVKNLLGLARKELYEFSPIDLNESIQNTLNLLSHELLVHPISIVFDAGEDFPKLVASRENLQSVWINIIMNAIEAIDENEGEINITTRYSDGEFTITIRDNGPGIPESQVSKIFEPFFTTKSPVKGTGLGLSVVHRIIKSHGGRIIVESKLGRGTQFTIILPENKQS
jgi:two-component system, NtrC family, sensor kinase